MKDPRPARYQPLYTARADMPLRAGDRASAREAYRRAITLSGNAVERAGLGRRLADPGP